MKDYVRTYRGFISEAMGFPIGSMERKQNIVQEIIDRRPGPDRNMSHAGWTFNPKNPEMEFERAICYIREFPTGEAVIDVTPFRGGIDEVRPLAWIDGNEIEIPEHYTIRSPKGFSDGVATPGQLSLIRVLATAALAAINKEIMNEIVSDPTGQDLFVFGERDPESFSELLEYFDGDVSWHPRLDQIVKKTKRGGDMFGV